MTVTGFTLENANGESLLVGIDSQTTGNADGILLTRRLRAERSHLADGHGFRVDPRDDRHALHDDSSLLPNPDGLRDGDGDAHVRLRTRRVRGGEGL